MTKFAEFNLPQGSTFNGTELFRGKEVSKWIGIQDGIPMEFGFIGNKLTFLKIGSGLQQHVVVYNDIIETKPEERVFTPPRFCYTEGFK